MSSQVWKHSLAGGQRTYQEWRGGESSHVTPELRLIPASDTGRSLVEARLRRHVVEMERDLGISPLPGQSIGSRMRRIAVEAGRV